MFIRTMDGELINSDSIIEIQGVLVHGCMSKYQMVQVITLMRMMHQNSYRKMNYDNLSQILNGLDYNGRPAVKSMEKIRKDGAAASDSCILK